MRVLLDTHVFLWWTSNNPNLSARAREVIANGENDIYFSAASGWEMAIKAGLGKLQLVEAPERFVAEQINENGFLVLPVSLHHALHILALPPHHRDPFDRMLVSQAQSEGLTIITADSYIRQYEVETVW
jgi:PIN domain nuclease of toxin-antitoxin system